MNNFTFNQAVMYNNGSWKKIDKISPDEVAVSLTVNGILWLTFMCSPFQIEELAVGFLFNENVIKDHEEIAQIWVCANRSNVDIWLEHAAQPPTDWKRTSGCNGGQTKNQAVAENIVIDQELICPEIILDQFEKLLDSQNHYKSTRGIHCSLLTDGENINFAAEDIGRHNTIDKLAGLFLLNPQKMSRKLLLTTGRVSSEMLQKSVHLGASIVVSRTSPTEAAVQTAHELDVTLIGYARRRQFIVYTHPERLAISIQEEKETNIFCN